MAANLCTFDSTLTTFDSTQRTFDATTCQDVVEEPVPVRQGGKRTFKRYRLIEDPDRLLEELKVEEKKVEQEKKKLTLLVKRLVAPNVEGALYQHLEYKVQKVEQKIDDRLSKIAELQALIQQRLDEEEDEELLLL